jgi:RNA polymerase sigma-70 factor (ECF subfamily)
MDWDVVFEELLPKVYRYFCYRVGEGQLAEDLTSTTFEKAWRKRRRYRRDLGAFSTWLFTIAKNVSIDHFRTAHETDSFDDIQLPDVRASSPEIETIARDEFAQLTTLVAQLSDREQELLALKYGAGLANYEIAALMKLTASNVGVILHRAVKQLRAQWGTSHE